MRGARSGWVHSLGVSLLLPRPLTQVTPRLHSRQPEIFPGPSTRAVVTAVTFFQNRRCTSLRHLRRHLAPSVFSCDSFLSADSKGFVRVEPSPLPAYLYPALISSSDHQRAHLVLGFQSAAGLNELPEAILLAMSMAFQAQLVAEARCGVIEASRCSRSSRRAGGSSLPAAEIAFSCSPFSRGLSICTSVASSSATVSHRNAAGEPAPGGAASRQGEGSWSSGLSRPSPARKKSKICCGRV